MAGIMCRLSRKLRGKRQPAPIIIVLLKHFGKKTLQRLLRNLKSIGAANGRRLYVISPFRIKIRKIRIADIGVNRSVISLVFHLTRINFTPCLFIKNRESFRRRLSVYHGNLIAVHSVPYLIHQNARQALRHLIIKLRGKTQTGKIIVRLSPRRINLKIPQIAAAGRHRQNKAEDK